MRGPLLALCFVSLSLAWLVFFGAGVRQTDWEAALLFLGATALFYWTFRSGQTPPRLPAWHVAALWALPIYAAFQLAPLPLALLQALSPARANITVSLASVLPSAASSAPISLAPAAAVVGFFSLLGYLTVFSLLRDFSWRYTESRPWLVAAPLAFIASMEASIGVGQWIGVSSNVPLQGTLSDPEHFAGLMEIALPFTLVFGFISFRRHQSQTTTSSVPAARAATSWLAALLIGAALVHSPSQTSHVVVPASLFVLLALALIPRLKTKKLRWGGAMAAAVIALFAALFAAPPINFTESLAQLGATEKMPAETRLAVWNSSAALLGEYPWFGVGLGGFEPAFPKYQGSSEVTRVQNPHSDVLGLLIAFGIVGSVIVLVAIFGIVRPAVMGAIYLTDEPRRLLAVSIAASLTAVLLRTTLESTLSAPVIAMSFAWLAGLSQSSGLD